MYCVGSSDRQNATLPTWRPRVQTPPDALEVLQRRVQPPFFVAVITQPAECQSSKLERWVRIPLTALQTHAVIAQRAEQPPRKRQVAGSIPARGFERSTGISPVNKLGCVAQR